MLLAETDEPRSEFYPAVLKTAAVPGGVLFRIGEGIEDFERLLGLIDAGLDERGVDASLDLFEPLAVKRLPVSVPLVECRLRVAGERYHLKGTHYRWRVDPDAWTRVIGAAVRWCMAADRVGASLGVGRMARVAVKLQDDLDTLLFSAIAGTPIEVVDCASGGVDRWRMVAVERFRARVSLVEAGSTIQPHGWQESVRELIGFLKVNDASLAYGLVKHGSSVSGARTGRSLANDWPPRADFYAPHHLEQAFEDSYAPDTFAVQLLGPGYAGRIPHGPSWREIRLAEDRVLLEHVSPESWFGTEFAPLGGRPFYRDPAPDPPEVLVEGRADFTDILFTDKLVLEQP